MGLFDKFKKKHETPGVSGKVRHAVEEKKGAKEKKAKKTDTGAKGLTKDEIKAAQALESGAKHRPEESKKEEGKEKKPAKRVARDTKTAYKVIVKPIVTEKSSYGGSMSTYAFQVAKNATKPEVAKAVAAVYQVTPVSVRILNKKGKEIRFGKTSGTTKGTKKAYVTLKKGQTIDVTQ